MSATYQRARCGIAVPQIGDGRDNRAAPDQASRVLAVLSKMFNLTER